MQRNKILRSSQSRKSCLLICREIAEAVREINADYTRHSLAAREIARQFFEVEKVSTRSSIARAFKGISFRCPKRNLDAVMIKRDTSSTTRYEPMKAVRYNSKSKSWKETSISSGKLAKLREQDSEKFLKDGTPKLIGKLSAQLKRKSLQPA